MKKKLALVMACILACGCLFAACGDKKPHGGENGTSVPAGVAPSAIPVTVSETQYMYVTNADGSYETVVATDAEGNTHTYLKGIRPGAVSAGNEDNTQMFEIEKSDTVSRFIDILNSGRFSMEGYITAEGEKMPLSFSTYDNNIRMGTEVSNIALDFANVDGKTYLLSKQNKSYVELTESIKKSLKIDESTLSFNGFGSISNDDTIKSVATYNGKEVECYTATSAEGEIKFYVDGENIVKIELYNTTGVCDTMIETTKITGDISAADLQIPSDYKKQTYISFVGDVINSLS